MTDFTYENPLLDTLDESLVDEALAQNENRPRGAGFQPLPKGRYAATLTDWSTETVPGDVNYPLAGQRRIRATFETEHDGRVRKVFMDLTDYPARWNPKDGQERGDLVREYVLGAQLQVATGQRGKPLSEALEAARTTPIDLEVGLDKRDAKRNAVFAVHSTVRG